MIKLNVLVIIAFQIDIKLFSVSLTACQSPLIFQHLKRHRFRARKTRAARRIAPKCLARRNYRFSWTNHVIQMCDCILHHFPNSPDLPTVESRV